MVLHRQGCCCPCLFGPQVRSIRERSAASADTSLVASLYSQHLDAQRIFSPARRVLATSVAGSDIGDRINHALKACALQCTVYIPAGKLLLCHHDHAGVESIWQIQAERRPWSCPHLYRKRRRHHHHDRPPTRILQLLIEGFQLGGNPHAAAGIHLMPTNRITIRNMVIIGFSGGDGILVEGTNSSNIYDNLITNNKNGIRLIPTVVQQGHPVHCGASVERSSLCRERHSRHLQPDHEQCAMGHFRGHRCGGPWLVRGDEQSLYGQRSGRKRRGYLSDPVPRNRH